MCNESCRQFLFILLPMNSEEREFKERFYSPNNEFNGRLNSFVHTVQFIYVEYMIKQSSYIYICAKTTVISVYTYNCTFRLHGISALL